MSVSPQPVPRAPDQASEIVDSEAGERAYHGTLKWFDVTRGFGFVVADEPGVGDILIHFTVLQPHGRRSLPEGARVECIAVQRDRGLQAREIVSIDLSDAIEPAPRPRGGHADIEALADAAGAFEPVRVKWFNRLKGYGRSEEHTSELQSLMRISY